MAFKFGWSFEGSDSLLDDEDIGSSSQPTGSIAHESAKSATTASSTDDGAAQLQELSLQQLIGNLPPAISFSSLSVPLSSTGTASSSGNVTLLRRDLFDARFQILNEQEDSDFEEGAASSSKTARAPGLAYKSADAKSGGEGESDLVKGIYEGGLKTWEASLDLVDCLYCEGYRDNFEDGSGQLKSIQGKRLLEAGCGTALPTLYLLELLFRQILQEKTAENTDWIQRGKTVVHLQDYNAEVLLYITFCNVLLAFRHAKQSLAASTTIAEQASGQDSADSEARPASTSRVPRKRRPRPAPQASEGEHETRYTLDHDAETELNEVEITTELVDSFTSFLEEHDIEIRFFAGSWYSFAHAEASCQKYDLILTSETVYELESLPSLIDLLHRSAAARGPEMDEAASTSTSTLVACKRVYFGVGGGEVAFKEAVGAKDAEAEVVNVWSSGQGVERTVMSVEWST